MRKSALVLSIAMLAACAESPDVPPGGSPATMPTSGHMPFELSPQQVEGWVIYETVCWTCHGVDGRGDGPAVRAGTTTDIPPTFHTLDFARASAESLERRFRGGVGGADPAHPHMRYVASLLRPEHFVHALSFIPVLVYPPEIPGSALMGKRIYDSRCAGCHGLHGNGDGVAASAQAFIEARPADFTTDTLITTRDWDALFNRISEGVGAVHSASMPQWKTVLDENEIWNLVAFLATFQEGVLRSPYWSE